MQQAPLQPRIPNAITNAIDGVPKETSCGCDEDDENLEKMTARRRKGYIPYLTIYETQDEVRKQSYWIPGLSVDAKIIKVERDNSTAYHIMNPFLYTIELEHGKYKWQVVKCYQDFSYLRNRLLAHRAVERIKMPMRRAKNRIEEAMESDGEKEKDKSKVSGGNNTKITLLEKSVEMEEYSGEVTRNDFSDRDNQFVDDKRESSDTSLPHFPLIPDSMISPVHLEERRKRLEIWLQRVLSTAINRNYHETAEFLEVSRFSFINELGGKYKEGKVKKRPGGNKVYIGCKQFCVRWLLPWGKRWLIVKDSYVCYMNPSSEDIRLVLLFDEQFEINSIEFAAATIRPKELFLSNFQHVLNLKCACAEDCLYWIEIIKKILEDTGRIWMSRKPFGSSYPPRPNSYIQWFVDAKDYWDRICAMLEMAREEVLIADWWLCPEVYLRRPMAEGNHWRLDCVLKRQAEKGVRIFILIYKEMEMALGLNSLYSKRHLQNLHPNIKVMRHPDHYFGTGTFFWAHHEKLLIIDQLIAFVGGLDLCYGRWDDSRHVLTDLGSVQFSPRSEEFCVERADLDTMKDSKLKPRNRTNSTSDNESLHNVHRISEDILEDGTKIGEQITTIIEKNEEKETDTLPKRDNFKDRMHRVMNKIKPRSRESTPAEEATHHFRSAGLEGLETMDRTSEGGKTFIQFKNYSSFGQPRKLSTDGVLSPPTSNNKTTPLVMEPKSRTLMRRVVSNLRPAKAKRRWRMALDQEDTAEEYVINYCRFQETKVDMSGLQGAGKLWPGKDYVNYIVKDFVDVHEAYNDFINRYATPRMPWHDIHSIVYGNAARDVARHFIQRWNATKTEKLKNDSNYPYLLPKSYNSVRIPKVFFNSNTHVAEVQVLRSVSHWSTLIDKTEDSIQQAYLSLIANAKHYIYIENQFFVSMIGSVDVLNEICKVICDRIVRAHKNNECFRVYIMIPLLPGFEGDIGSTQYTALLAVLNWTYRSISQGPYSLFYNLRANGIDDPSKYVLFGSLRTHDVLRDKLVSELIYIHSKLLIVDDLYTIIGSANINDRSQAGNRDSEVCLLITDQEFSPSKMNGKDYQAGKFAFSLRKRLMEEHLGLLEISRHKTSPDMKISVDDPISDAFYLDVWCKSARQNTEIYEETFNCYPTDKVETFFELAEWRGAQTLAETEPEIAKEKLNKLVGNLIVFPTEFLKKENISPAITTKEGLVPSAVFT